MCVLTMTLASTATAALASSLVSAGIGTTAAAITSGAVVGAGLAAVDGAVMGAAASGITGGDVGEGALQGLWMGAAGGAIGGGLVEGLGAAGVLSNTPGMTGAADAANLGRSSLENTTTLSNSTDIVTKLDQGQEVASMMAELRSTGGVSLAPGSTSTWSKVATAENMLTAKEAVSDAGKTAGAVAGGGKSSSDGLTSDLIKSGASAGVQLAGSGIEAYGAYREGQDNADALLKQAEQQRLAAQSVIDSAEIESKDLARRQRLAIGRGKVASAANGIMLEQRAESSPAMWEQDAAAEAAWDREKLFANTNMRSQGLFTTGNDMIDQSKKVRRSGNLKAATSAIKGVVGAGVSLYGDRAVSLYA